MTIKKTLTVVLAFLVLFVVVIVEGCGGTDPTGPAVQLYDALMRGDCQRVGELWQNDDPQKHIGNCETHHPGEITNYQILGVETQGIPFVLEWATVLDRVEFSDRPPVEGHLNLVRRFPHGWELTKIE